MSYNGWKNYETWNVALWIGNDETIHDEVKYQCADYSEFLARLRREIDDGHETGILYQTPDGVSWNDSGLDIEALDEMIAEL